MRNLKNEDGTNIKNKNAEEFEIYNVPVEFVELKLDYLCHLNKIKNFKEKKKKEFSQNYRNFYVSKIVRYVRSFILNLFIIHLQYLLAVSSIIHTSVILGFSERATSS